MPEVAEKRSELMPELGRDRREMPAASKLHLKWWIAAGPRGADRHRSTPSTAPVWNRNTKDLRWRFRWVDALSHLNAAALTQ